MNNKLRYQKVNERKVLHKVKKHWVVLGTATLALLAMGAGSQIASADSGNNSTSSADEQLNQSQATADSSAAQSSSATDASASAVQPRQAVADASSATNSSAENVSLVSSQPANNGNLSASAYLAQDTTGQASLGFNVTGSDNATYHQRVSVDNVNGYNSPYVIQYANDGSNAPITGIKNLVQHRQTSDGSVVSVSAAVADNSRLVTNVSSTPSTPILVSDANVSGSTASAVSVLELGQGPLNSGSNNAYYSGDKLWWTFDPIANPNFKGASNNLTYIVGGSTTTTTPVKIKFQDGQGNQVAPDQWVTGDNIYPGNSFELNVPNVSGYQFNGGFSAQGAEHVENNNGQPVIKGTFSNWASAEIALNYQKNEPKQVTGSIKYYDVSDPSNKQQIGDANISGNEGDIWHYSAQAQVNQFQNNGYQLVSSQSAIPADNLTLGANNDYEIDFTHTTKTYNANDALPSGLNQSDLTKTYKRIINFTGANNQAVATPITQTVTFNRNATYDEVTHATTFSNWVANGSSQFNAVTTPTISGYTASQKQIGASNVSANSTYNPIEVFVEYNKNTNEQNNNSYQAYRYQDTNLPSGLQSSDLSRTFFKNFKLMGANNNVIKQVSVPVNYHRTAVYENGQFKGYALDNSELVNADTKTDAGENNAEWYADSNSIGASDLTNRLGSEYSMDVTNGWNSIVLSLVNSKANEGSIAFNSLSSGSGSSATSSSTSNAGSSSSSTVTSSSSSTTSSSSATTSSSSTTTTSSSSATTSSSSTTTISSSTTSYSSATTSASSSVTTSGSSTATTTSVTSSASSSTTESSSSTSQSASTSSNSSSTSVNSGATDNDNGSESATDNGEQSTTSNNSQQSSGENSVANANTNEAEQTTTTNENQGTTSQSKSATTNHRSKLPQTGEDDQTLAEIGLGLLLISFAGMFGGLYRRKQN
ncbi:mucin-binding protein [Lactobacillaceae bacterium Melli_B3]